MLRYTIRHIQGNPLIQNYSRKFWEYNQFVVTSIIILFLVASTALVLAIVTSVI